MTSKRPNPEELLKQVQKETREAERGKLKIYLGAAPGVGKTYTMLEDALTKRAEGLDVVAGIVESHGRSEIESLLKNLEILPKQSIDYRGKILPEFDIDAALKRNPGLILIDEAAHTNAPGLRHTKRWQDIKEILDRGIDVYTTLNIQHIESLNDIVSQITHISVKETVPDSLLELAETIELIDLPPEDLLKRLQEGKIYFPEQIAYAKENFFRIGNLIALRELALRAAAERVGKEALLYRRGHGIKQIWPVREKILVCVGSSAMSIKVIRAAKRMSISLNAEWIAVHIDAARLSLSEEQRNRATRNLRLAEQLGAQTCILTGIDVVKEIMDFAHEQNITKIIMGKKIRPRWKDILFSSLADEVVRHSGEIDVHIITGVLLEEKPATSISSTRSIPWKIYGISLGIVIIATIIDSLLYPYLKASNLIMVYLLGITFIALFGRTGPSLIASLLSVLAYDFFFVSTHFSFEISDIQDFFTLAVMFIIAQVISHLSILSRRQAETARLAERRTNALHLLSRQLASSRGIHQLLEITVHYLADVFDSNVMALLPDNNRLTLRTKSGAGEHLDDKEYSVAQWVYELGQAAGLGTDTLPFSQALYVPLQGSQKIMGVLRLSPYRPGELFTPEQMHLLEDCTHQIALALEVDLLNEQI